MGTLDIGRGGAVRLDEASAERLSERRYALVATPEALLVGVVSDGVAAPAGRVVLVGDLSRIAFSEVVSLIAHTRTSGVLRVDGDSATRTVIFSEGEVRGASSERIGERLGETAVRMGLLKADQLDELSERGESGRRAGREMIERDFLSERDLWNAIQEHVTTIFQAILLEPRGTFVLTDELVDDEITVPGLSAEVLLMEGVRRLDELRGAARPGSVGATPERVLDAFNGAFRDIFATAHDAGAGEALLAVASSVFDDDPAHAPIFQGVEFSVRGELSAEVLERVEEAAREGDADAATLLGDALSTVMLFLLFVAGEHLQPAAHQALHSRVKTLISRG